MRPMPRKTGAPAVRDNALQAGPAFLLIGLGRILREEVEEELHTHHLTLRHLSALGHLSRQPGLSYSELARRAGVTAQSMQATLTHLQELGAVERRTVPGRGRRAELHVTESGEELLGAGHQILRDADGRLLADLPAEQRLVLGANLMTAFIAAAARRRGGPPHRQAPP